MTLICNTNDVLYRKARKKKKKQLLPFHLLQRFKVHMQTLCVQRATCNYATAIFTYDASVFTIRINKLILQKIIWIYSLHKMMASAFPSIRCWHAH